MSMALLDYITPLAEERAELQQKKKAIEERIEEINAAAAPLLEKTGPVKLAYGSWTIEQKTGSTLDKEALTMRLLQEKIPATKVKKLLEDCTRVWSRQSVVWRANRDM